MGVALAWPALCATPRVDARQLHEAVDGRGTRPASGRRGQMRSAVSAVVAARLRQRGGGPFVAASVHLPADGRLGARCCCRGVAAAIAARHVAALANRSGARMRSPATSTRRRHHRAQRDARPNAASPRAASLVAAGRAAAPTPDAAAAGAEPPTNVVASRDGGAPPLTLDYVWISDSGASPPICRPPPPPRRSGTRGPPTTCYSPSSCCRRLAPAADAQNSAPPARAAARPGRWAFENAAGGAAAATLGRRSRSCGGCAPHSLSNARLSVPSLACSDVRHDSPSLILAVRSRGSPRPSSGRRRREHPVLLRIFSGKGDLHPRGRPAPRRARARGGGGCTPSRAGRHARGSDDSARRRLPRAASRPRRRACAVRSSSSSRRAPTRRNARRAERDVGLHTRRATTRSTPRRDGGSAPRRRAPARYRGPPRGTRARVGDRGLVAVEREHGRAGGGARGGGAAAAGVDDAAHRRARPRARASGRGADGEPPQYGTFLADALRAERRLSVAEQQAAAAGWSAERRLVGGASAASASAATRHVRPQAPTSVGLVAFGRFRPQPRRAATDAAACRRRLELRRLLVAVGLLEGVRSWRAPIARNAARRRRRPRSRDDQLRRHHRRRFGGSSSSAASAASTRALRACLRSAAKRARTRAPAATARRRSTRATLRARRPWPLHGAGSPHSTSRNMTRCQCCRGNTAPSSTQPVRSDFHRRDRGR